MVMPNLPNLKKIEKNYPSETSDRFSFVDGKGEIGFISSISNLGLIELKDKIWEMLN